MTLLEVEKSFNIAGAPCFRTPIWYFSVYETGTGFSWFSSSSLGKTANIIGTLTINAVSYTKVERIEDLMEKTFCQIENIVYVHIESGMPAWRYALPQFNVIIGFSEDRTLTLDGVVYHPGVLQLPEISDKADNLEYARMAFKNDNIDLINTEGDFDNTTAFFGNPVRVKLYDNGQVKNLYEYYIKNIKIKADKTTFVCGDRREKLEQKLPNGMFTRAEYPKMKKELEGELRQDVYGQCEWIKCVCVDELDIYINNYGGPEVKKPWRTFYASRKITALGLTDERNPQAPAFKPNHVWVKQTQDVDKFGERWTPCPVNRVPGTDTPVIPEEEHEAMLERGEFVLHIGYCMPSTWTGYDVPEVFEVTASGIFNPQTTPLEIIKELLNHYCGIPYNNYTFKTEEIENEIGFLAPVGIVYDSEMGVFEAIEKLQDASNYGFQFKSDYNLYTARRDDDERPASAVISAADIVNIEEVEIDMNRDYYATIIDVPYGRKYRQETASHYIAKNNRGKLIIANGVDKTYAPEAYLVTRDDAADKARRLENVFKKTRFIIRNVSILNHSGLKVYDIVMMDLRIPLERKNGLRQAALLGSPEEKEALVFGEWREEKIAADFGAQREPHREFGGVLKCKVTSVKLDGDMIKNTVDFVEAG